MVSKAASSTGLVACGAGQLGATPARCLLLQQLPCPAASAPPAVAPADRRGRDRLPGRSHRAPLPPTIPPKASSCAWRTPQRLSEACLRMRSRFASESSIRPRYVRQVASSARRSWSSVTCASRTAAFIRLRSDSATFFERSR